VDAFTVYRVLRLASASDSFAGTGVRDPTGASGKEAGRQWDTRFRVVLVPQLLRLDSGVTWFDMGPFMKSAPNATRLSDTVFFYTDLTWTFAGHRSASR
jgi:hypothetical protein